MSLHNIYNSYVEFGYSGIDTSIVESGKDFFYLALLAFAENKLSVAAEIALQASQLDSNNCVFYYGAQYLKKISKIGKNNVYINDEGFNAFINGGANVNLYRETSCALKSIYREYKSFNLFDIGVGDGKAILPALTHNITHIDLLEPSKMMLKRLCLQLDSDFKEQSYSSICCTFQKYAEKNTGYWDIIEGTYSFHSFSYSERVSFFEWLRIHGKRVLIAEFDVHDFGEMFLPERYLNIIKRYLKGITEYSTDRDLVALDFLMPVMFGYFDKSISRTTYEQPIQNWVDDLKNAGFNKVKTKMLYPYWWSDAYIIDAS